MNNASETEKVISGLVGRRNRGVSKRILIIITILATVIGIGSAVWFVWQRKANDDRRESETRITYSQEAKNELNEYKDDRLANIDDPAQKASFYVERFYIKAQAEDYKGALSDYKSAAALPEFAPEYNTYLVLYDVHMKLGDSNSAKKALDDARDVANKLPAGEMRDDALFDISQKQGQSS